jgi:tyrosyl-tRNA synthetase
VKSNGEGFRAIEQGGLMIDDVKITDKKYNVTTDLFIDGAILIKKGKKTFHRVKI